MTLQTLSRRVYQEALSTLPFRHRLTTDYFRKHRRRPDLTNPRLHSERLLFRSLYDTDPILTSLSSKQRAKEVVLKTYPRLRARIPRTQWTGSPEQLIERLPSLAQSTDPWVLKPDQLGGGIALLNDAGGSVTQGDLRRLMRESHRTQKLFRRLAPRALHTLPEVFILEDRIGFHGRPIDYKVHTFRGKPRMFSVYSGRTAHTFTVQHFDADWTLLFGRNDSGQDLRPENHVREALIDAASQIHFDLAYTRVDFYWDGQQLWLGEISPFGHIDGIELYPILDAAMGDWWTQSTLRNLSRD
nr:ATP-grasp fold amidoligase family protein [Tessaracoccus aquimaris]